MSSRIRTCRRGCRSSPACCGSAWDERLVATLAVPLG
jgi:hypothetical protein